MIPFFGVTENSPIRGYTPVVKLMVWVSGRVSAIRLLLTVTSRVYSFWNLRVKGSMVSTKESAAGIVIGLFRSFSCRIL